MKFSNTNQEQKTLAEIRQEAYEQGRADAIDEVKELAKHYLIDAMNLENATKYGNKNAKQQDISYGTIMRYEIADCVDDFVDSLDRLKEKQNENLQS